MKVTQPGVSAFTELSDVPHSYLGEATKTASVNALETGLEFTEGGPGGAAVWGDITGTLSDQTDLQAALDAKLSVANIDGGDSDSTYGGITGIDGGTSNSF